MVYTARIDVAPIRHVVIMSAIALLFMITSIILGQTGPEMWEEDDYSAYDCDDQNHLKFNPSTCHGVQLGKGVWSNRMETATRQLNKEWYCVLTPYLQQNSTLISSEVLIYTLIEAKNDQDNVWTKLVNSSVNSLLPCSDPGQACEWFVLVYEENINYDLYGLTILFHTKDGHPLRELADVVFSFFKNDPEFSKMALILKVIFLGLSIALFAFHYLKLKGTHSHWESWTDEQRLFVFLLIALVGFNNPFYPLEYIAKGWFLPFLGSFLELLFTCTLFAFWFVMAQKLRSPDGSLSFTSYVKLTLVLVLIFAVTSATLYGISSTRDEKSPLFGIADHVTSVKVLYYLASAFYVAIIIIFFSTLVISIQPINERFYLRARFAFFAIPTFIVIISVLIGLFSGILGPFGRDAPSFVYFHFMNNIYVYVLLWGYWPVQRDYVNPGEIPQTEETKFVVATQPIYTDV